MWRATCAAARSRASASSRPYRQELPSGNMVLRVVVDGAVLPSSVRRGTINALPSRSSSSTTTTTTTTTTAASTAVVVPSEAALPASDSASFFLVSSETTTSSETTSEPTTTSTARSRNPTAAAIIRDGLLNLHRAGLRIQETPKTRKPLRRGGDASKATTTTATPLSSRVSGGGGAVVAADFLLGGAGMIDDDDGASSTAAAIRAHRVLRAASDCLDDLCELDQGLTLGGEPIALVGARVSPDGRTAGILWALPWSVLLQLEEAGTRGSGIRQALLREELTIRFSDELDTPGTRAQRAMTRFRSLLSGKLAKVLRRPPKVQFHPAPPEEVAEAVRGLSASSVESK